MGKKFRAGDAVKHLPSGETWTLGGSSNGYVYPLGWPPSSASENDCELVKAASDEYHRETLSRILLNDEGRRKHVDAGTLDRVAEVEATALFSSEAVAEINHLMAEFAQLSSKLAELQRQIADKRMSELRRVLDFTG